MTDRLSGSQSGAGSMCLPSPSKRLRNCPVARIKDFLLTERSPGGSLVLLHPRPRRIL